MLGMAMLVFVLLFASLALRLLFGPRPIEGVPHKPYHFWLPFGSLVSLGLHFVNTGKVFDWFSLECLHLRSPIAQLFVPSFSLTQPVVVIADLHEIEDIVTRRNNEIDRANLMHDFFGLLIDQATIGMRTSPRFKQQRHMWNRILAPDFMDHVVAPRLHSSICKLVQIWRVRVERAPGCAFEVEQDLRQTTLEGMWDMLLGSELGLLAAVKAHACDAALSFDRNTAKVAFQGHVQYPGLYNALSTMLTCLDWVLTGFSSRFYTWVFMNFSNLPECQSTVDLALGQAVDNTLLQVPSKDLDIPRSALHEVAQKESTLNAGSHSVEDKASFKDEMLELLITGHETTASSLGWALKYLTDHPRAQERLRNSLAAVFSGTSGVPSSAEIAAADLPYLDAVIAETLRVSCTGPVSFRQAQQDCAIFGRKIPAGTPIVLVTAGPSYDAPLHERPQILRNLRSRTSQLGADKKGILQWQTMPAVGEFEPERWLDVTGRFNPQAGPSLPFSAGPRGCFGKKIALLEMRLMLCLLFWSFELPILAPGLSKYTARDSLTRKPTCCYVAPRPLVSEVWDKSETI